MTPSYQHGDLSNQELSLLRPEPKVGWGRDAPRCIDCVTEFIPIILIPTHMRPVSHSGGVAGAVGHKQEKA